MDIVVPPAQYEQGSGFKYQIYKGYIEKILNIHHVEIYRNFKLNQYTIYLRERPLQFRLMSAPSARLRLSLRMAATPTQSIIQSQCHLTPQPIISQNLLKVVIYSESVPL